jgi:hypothetical protein
MYNDGCERYFSKEWMEERRQRKLKKKEDKMRREDPSKRRRWYFDEAFGMNSNIAHP